MREAVICEPLRTPVGGFGGSLRDVPAHELAATVIRGRAGPHRPGPRVAVDDVLLGHCYPTMDAPAIGRVAALDAGLPVTVPGAPDRPALRFRAAGRAVRRDAGAVGHRRTSCWPAGPSRCRTRPSTRRPCGGASKAGPGVLLHDALVARVGSPPAGSTSRCPAACSRRRKTCAASTRSRGRSRTSTPSKATGGPPRPDAGRFADEIVPVHGHERARATWSSTGDEHIRPDSTVEKLARLRPMLGRDDPDATVTAGNASGQNDGAAVCVVTHPARAADLGLRPLVRLVSWGVGGVAPATMGIGPVPAVAKALDLADVAAQGRRPDRAERGVRRPGAGLHPRVVASAGDFDRLNVNGSGHLPRPPRRGHRRPHPGHADPRDGPARRPLRPRDHVHRRRPGPRRPLRTGLISRRRG